MKLGLVIGINYKGSPNELSGCLVDAYRWKWYLINHRGYKEENITMLIEEEATAANIAHSLFKIIRRSNEVGVSEVFITYSGHGSQTQLARTVETDGLDECLVPYDFMTVGMIVDDTLTDYFAHVSLTPKVFFVVDACHSGTMLDKMPPNVSLISACQDSQTAADIGYKGGAFSYTLLNHLEVGKALDLEVIEATVAELRREGFTQIPRLTVGSNLVTR